MTIFRDRESYFPLFFLPPEYCNDLYVQNYENRHTELTCYLNFAEREMFLFLYLVYSPMAWRLISRTAISGE